MADLIQMQVNARIDPKSQANMQRDLNRIGNSLRLNLGAGSLSGGGGIGASSQAINGLASNISRVNGNMNTLNNHFGNLQTQLRQTSANTAPVNRGFSTMLGSMTSMIGKFAQWALIANLIYAPFRLLKDGISTLAEIDKHMINIAKVTEMSAEEMKRFAETAAYAGSELGKTAQEYLQAATDFARAGLVDQIEELTEKALLLSNVGDMGIADSTKTIIATIQGMNLEYSDTINVIDQMDVVANKNATTVQNLSDGMRTYAATSKVAGQNINETVALIGAGTSILQRSGQEIKIPVSLCCEA